MRFDDLGKMGESGSAKLDARIQMIGLKELPVKVTELGELVPNRECLIEVQGSIPSKGDVLRKGRIVFQVIEA